MHKTTLASGLILIAAAFLLAPSGARAAADKPAVTLVTDGKDACPIVVPAKPGPGERAAAEGLARYLGQISGATFRIVRNPKTLPERAIVIGRAGIDPPADLGDSGFIIRTVGGRLHIVGGGDAGTGYGAFDLLERLGCRWWSHDEEEVPRRATITLPKLDVVVRPPFRMHDLYNKEAQNPHNFFIYKARAKSPIRFTSGHSLCPYLKPYAEKRPDFLPMDKTGKRAFNNLHMNYTAPGMSEALAEALGKVVEKRKREVKHSMYFAGMGDWYGGMDFSPASKKIYAEETWTDPDGRKKPGYMATLLRMVNGAAEILEKKYPGIVVGTFAYMSLEAPPAKTRPRPNVVLWVPRLRHDGVRSILESKANQSFLRNLEQWCKIAPGRVYIWEYGVNFSNFMVPFPCLRSMAENIKAYHKLGVAGIKLQGNYVSTGSDLVVLKNYVWRKLLWDPSRKVDELLREFCEGYYGPAAGEMIRYVNTIEDYVRQKKIRAHEFSNPVKTYLTPELRKQLRGILAKALARTKGNDADLHYRRVREARVSLEAVVLWNAGPLEERDGRLVRTDLGEYTYPRALELIKYCRQASPREWGSGHSYRRGFLTLHGGPVERIANGPVTVKVAPVRHGRIWSIEYRGRRVLGESVDWYRPTGQSYFDVVGRPTPTALKMQGELGVFHWGNRPKQRAYKTVEVADDGTVRITGKVRMLRGGGRYKKAFVRVETTYPAVAGLKDVKVEALTVDLLNKQDRWVQVDLSKGKARRDRRGRAIAGQTAVPLGTLKRLRITLPKAGLTVLDTYYFPETLDGPASPETTGGEVVYDAKNKALITVVRTMEVKASLDKDNTCLRREIRITSHRAASLK